MMIVTYGIDGSTSCKEFEMTKISSPRIEKSIYINIERGERAGNMYLIVF